MEFIQIKNTDRSIINKIFDIEIQSFDIPWKKSDIRNEIQKKNSLSYSLKEKDNLIGYILATIVFDEINIHKMCINPQYRQRGFGKILFKEFIQIADEKKIKKIFLEVKKINFIAYKFYQHFGFHINRVRLYGKSEEHIIYEMIKTLD